MAALCKAPTKSAGIGLSITAVCKNAGKKTLGQDDFFVVNWISKEIVTNKCQELVTQLVPLPPSVSKGGIQGSNLLSSNYWITKNKMNISNWDLLPNKANFGLFSNQTSWLQLGGFYKSLS